MEAIPSDDPKKHALELFGDRRSLGGGACGERVPRDIDRSTFEARLGTWPCPVPYY